MFTCYRTKGIIVKKEDRGEADQLLTIYTKDFGRLEVLGRGIRKITSKLRSATETFYLSEIEFVQGKVYKTLTDSLSIERFSHLRKDLKRLALAYRILILLDNLVKSEEPDEKIWQLLKEVFQKLNNLQLKIFNLQLIYYYFLWNLLSFLGYQPQLFHCAHCQKKLLPENLYFNPREGGVICEKCFAEIKKGLAVKPELIKILRLILKRDWPILVRLKVENFEEKSLNIISSVYLKSTATPIPENIKV